jgi:predicted CxxxxCH...CXXCH cytochrome family protein
VLRWAVVALFATGCSTARPVDEGGRRCIDWKDDVGPRLQESCGGCHSGDAPAGGYDVTQYLQAIGAARDGGVEAAAGDPGSRLLSVLDPATADATHQPFAALVPTLRAWVVDCDLSYFLSAVHPGGILDPASSDFHGAEVVRLGYNLPLCAKCHGADYAGGASAASCRTCHADGPTGCTTCHGAPPPTGAHLAHTTSTVRKIDCSDCHVVPAAYTDVGHIFKSDGTIDAPPAEVTFAAFAGPDARYADGRCQNVYCHGGTYKDARAAVPSPGWLDGKPAGACGACHGLPPENHANGRCSLCHPRVADDAAHLIDPKLHLDGRVSLGDDSGTCAACHPTLSGPHAVHTGAPHRLSAAIGCDGCHQVPTAVDSPGHIDSPNPVVFPDGTTLAHTDGATARWDLQSRTCSDVYCHGGGRTLSADAAKTILRTPIWQLGSNAATCGACHGVPPVDAKHTTTMTLADCARCHAASIDASGSLIPGGRHLDGVVDAQ